MRRGAVRYSHVVIAAPVVVGRPDGSVQDACLSSLRPGIWLSIKPMPDPKRTTSGVLGGILGIVALSTVPCVLVTANITHTIAVSAAAASRSTTTLYNHPQIGRASCR